MKTIWYLPSAELDLASIWEFVAESDADAADRILDRIDSATNILKNYPFAGRARPEIAPDVRSKPVGKYLSSIVFGAHALKSCGYGTARSNH